MKRVVILMIMMLVGCYNSADKPHIYTTVETATVSIERLRKDVVGNREVTITAPVVVTGRITSSDQQENIYGSIVVEDDTGAVEVRVGLTPLYATYPEGLKVSLHLEGCRAGYYRGVLQVGEQDLDGSVAKISSREGLDRVVRRGTDISKRDAERVEIADLTPEMCGRLVRIENLRAVASTSIDELLGQTMEDALWCGGAIFKSAAGDSIAVHTSDYAHYAYMQLPDGEVSITGILEWGTYERTSKECYHITMRYEEDCIPM